MAGIVLCVTKKILADKPQRPWRSTEKEAFFKSSKFSVNLCALCGEELLP
jgi:hypothetical protein